MQQRNESYYALVASLQLLRQSRFRSVLPCISSSMDQKHVAGRASGVVHVDDSEPMDWEPSENVDRFPTTTSILKWPGLPRVQNGRRVTFTLPNDHSDKASALYRSFSLSRSTSDCLAVIQVEEEEDGSVDEVEEEGWHSIDDSSNTVNDISSDNSSDAMNEDEALLSETC